MYILVIKKQSSVVVMFVIFMFVFHDVARYDDLDPARTLMWSRLLSSMQRVIHLLIL
jgi:uncharacterized membrane protein YjfL (UPF0719 family)